MLDHPSFAPMQRAQGRAAVALVPGAGRPRIGGLAQSGSAKVFLPAVHSAVPEVVFLNTAGGLTGGDRFTCRVDLGAGLRAVATTQTAERGYASAGGQAEVAVTLSLGAGAELHWLPQETILFQGASLARRTRADLAPGARLVLAEMVVLGRAAMGETLESAAFSDRREVWSSGRPVWVDPLVLGAGALAPRPALLAGVRAFATLALIGPGAEDAAGALRAALPDTVTGAVLGAVSGWDGKCLARLTAPDALPLKRAVATLLSILRQGAPLPRVWQI